MKKLLFPFIFFAFCCSALSQYQNVLISNYYAPHEVSIMINPKNTNQVVAGANIYYFTSSDTSLSGYYYSTNGGMNWSGGSLLSNLAMPSGDPVIIVDTSGYFYYIQNSNWRHTPPFDRHLVMKSTNGGMNWPTGSTYGKNGIKLQDKPWGCVDWSNSIYRNNIYSCWTEFSEYFTPTMNDSSIILFTKSTDGGMNWSTPLRISKRKGDGRDSSNTLEGAVPCTGPNGEIYVSWAGPVVYNSTYAIFFNKSTDGGNNWLDSERVAAFQPGGWGFNVSGLLRCNGFPVTCCDISNGPFRGNIYINFSDQRNGITDTDIWFVKSTNGGATWSNAKRVNNDAPGKHQFFNWMCVDQVTGYIYVVFYDQRGLSALQTNVYLARSTDGGETFQNVKINNSTFNLNFNIFLGDYNCISAHNGKVRPIWTKSENTYNTSIYTAIIDTFYSIRINKISENITDNYELEQNYPNPFNSKTKIIFSIKKQGNAVLTVFDISGKKVSTLINEFLSEGKYESIFDASELSSGIYFYRLTCNEYSDARKLLLIK